MGEFSRHQSQTEKNVSLFGGEVSSPHQGHCGFSKCASLFSSLFDHSPLPWVQASLTLCQHLL